MCLFASKIIIAILPEFRNVSLHIIFCQKLNAAFFPTSESREPLCENMHSISLCQTRGSAGPMFYPYEASKLLLEGCMFSILKILACSTNKIRY